MASINTTKVKVPFFWAWLCTISKVQSVARMTPICELTQPAVCIIIPGSLVSSVSFLRPGTRSPVRPWETLEQEWGIPRYDGPAHQTKPTILKSDLTWLGEIPCLHWTPERWPQSASDRCRVLSSGHLTHDGLTSSVAWHRARDPIN